MTVNRSILQACRLHYVRRLGFTLVELLVVVSIVAIIVAISVGAMLFAPQQARIRGTEALISKIDAKLNSLLGEFNRNRSNYQPIPLDYTLAGGTQNAQRARVIAEKRVMRQTFPELFYINVARDTDNIDNDGDGQVDEINPNSPPPSSRPYPARPGDEIIVGQWNPLDWNGDGALDQFANQLPPAAVKYRAYVEQAFIDFENARVKSGAAIPFHAAHLPATARAECLYMIITNCGTDTDDFGPDEVRDTDGDGLMEFVDRFGNPIQFYLWPSYFGANSLTLPLSSNSPMQKPGGENDPDDAHQLLVQADWWKLTGVAPTDARPSFERLFHSLTHFTPGPNSGWQPKGFRTYPLIVSAGPDGGLGFWCDPAFVGADRIMGTMDDSESGTPPLKVPAIGMMLSPGPDGVVGSGDDGNPALAAGATPAVLRPLHYSAALRIMNPSIDGYGMDGDNIDNHHVRAH